MDANANANAGDSTIALCELCSDKLKTEIVKNCNTKILSRDLDLKVIYGAGNRTT